ncbi:MAG: ABC transporter permease [Deferribacteraceae bacterium]|jgi:phospholipid/cholesterol/gamma-HCH transport system permease protein|nr:ABC transporter permease [Deferribacteraceae bacterium]
MRGILAFFGSIGLSIIRNFGLISIMLASTFRLAVRPPFRFKLIIKQMEFIGVSSLMVVLLVGLFTGIVFQYQAYKGFYVFGMEAMTGMVVALAMARELGPVLSSIMIAARCSSAIAAELGTMRVTEQIDALFAQAVNPIQYLVVPRVLAGMIVTPILSFAATISGMAGGYFVGVNVLGINSHLYYENMVRFLKMSDFADGGIKALVFGILLTIIGCTKGYNASGGAMGVGVATTEAVALSCIMIIFFDMILTVMLY